jgi:hypothetical protein
MGPVLRAGSVGLLSVCGLTGCVRIGENNPDVRLSIADAKTEVSRLNSEHVKLARPVVVLGGYHAPGHVPWLAARSLCKATTGDEADFLSVAYPFVTRIETATEQVLREVQARWPSDNPDETIEVDVVGISMGGLVARWAALPPDQRIHPLHGPNEHANPRRLKIAHLYTLATPHSGARLAEVIRPDDAAADMSPGSDFLTYLNGTADCCGYPIVCYSQQRDYIVGAKRAALPGTQPIWTNGPWAWGHFLTPHNPWFIADIARRLRGEDPLLNSTCPPRTD